MLSDYWSDGRLELRDWRIEYTIALRPAAVLCKLPDRLTLFYVHFDEITTPLSTSAPDSVS